MEVVDVEVVVVLVVVVEVVVVDVVVVVEVLVVVAAQTPSTQPLGDAQIPAYSWDYHSFILSQIDKCLLQQELKESLCLSVRPSVRDKFV